MIMNNIKSSSLISVNQKNSYSQKTKRYLQLSTCSTTTYQYKKNLSSASLKTYNDIKNNYEIIKRFYHPKGHHQQHNVPTFYNNHILDQYAAKETQRVTLRQLTVFGRTLTHDKLLKSANYLRSELPVRLAHRIRDFQNLPFIVGTNPHIELVYKLYWDAFEQFRSVPIISNLDDNDGFCRLTDKMLDTHLIATPQLAVGIAETSQQMDPKETDRFMNEMLRSRIGRRVLAEQHLAITDAFMENQGRMKDGMIGVVNMYCHAGKTIEKCISIANELFEHMYGCLPPKIVIDGQVDTTFTYIPDHLEYILFELMKNSMYHTMLQHAPSLLESSSSDSPVSGSLEFEHHQQQQGSSSIGSSHLGKLKQSKSDLKRDYTNINSTTKTNKSKNSSKIRSNNTKTKTPILPPIRITVAESDNQVMFRISDQGGGIPKETMNHLWSFSHMSKQNLLKYFDKMPHLAAKAKKRVSPSLHLGLGLCVSRAYANYWGGSIQVHSMQGYGTDVYLTISTGNQEEHLKYDHSSTEEQVD